MKLENICQRFFLYTGMSESEGEPWKVLCQDAMREVERCLLVAGSAEDREAELENYAAAKAFFQWALCFVGDGGADRIGIGDLTLAGDPKILLDSAEKIVRQALLPVVDLVETKEFAFLRTSEFQK